MNGASSASAIHGFRQYSVESSFINRLAPGDLLAERAGWVGNGRGRPLAPLALPAVVADVAQLRQYPTEFTIVLDGIELNTTFMKSGRMMQGLIQRLPSLESLVLFKH